MFEKCIKILNNVDIKKQQPKYTDNVRVRLQAAANSLRVRIQ